MRRSILARGSITPLGHTWSETWDALLRNIVADAQPFAFGTDDPVLVNVTQVKSLSRDIGGHQFAVGAAARLLQCAIDQVIREVNPSGPYRIFASSNHGEHDAMMVLASRSPDLAEAEDVLRRSLLWDSLPEVLENAYPQATEVFWIDSACTSGLHALMAAFIDGPAAVDDECAVVVSGDALSAIGVAGFWRSGATSDQKCLPFHTRRGGLLVGEGAVSLCLGRENPCRDPLGWVSTITATCDATHPTHPHPGGIHLEAAIRAALHEAQIEPGKIAAVVAHGTGTTANDPVEQLVLCRIFGSRQIPVTSVKGHIGHIMGAAGLLNCLVALETSRSGLLPPTATDGGPVLADLDLVTERPREVVAGSPVLALASGFGGNNVAVIVEAA